jgi:hypothetical protein
MIEQRARQLLDKEGFIEAYYEGIRAGMGCKESFECVNREFFLFFGRPKYVDYDSFRHVRDYKTKE